MFHILVVDDDKNTRKLIHDVLEQSGYTVLAAANGEEALEIMDKEFVDLVVLDIMMLKWMVMSLPRYCVNQRTICPFS